MQTSLPKYPRFFYLPTMNLSASILSSSSKPILAVKILPLPSTIRRTKHLALLIDTSGSMEGVRIEAVKKTLHLLVDAMPIEDVLSLIGYSSESTILLNAVSIEKNRAPLHALIDTLYADGGTNLACGVENLKLLANVDSVFLLTDGHINEGLQSASGLLRILGSDLPPLNTLGYGSDYNIRTLKALSVRTRGSHTYADSAELIPAIIGDIVGGLASEVGKQGTLHIPAGWRCLELGYDEGDTTYNVGTLIADKEQWVLLEQTDDLPAPASLTFSWTTDKVHTNTVQIDTSISKKEISQQANRARVAYVFGNVLDMLENGDREGAKTSLQSLLAELSASPSKDCPFVIRLLAQVDEMLEDLKHHAWNPDLVPRMNSNQVALGVQRGIVSRLQSVQPEEDTAIPARALTGVLDSFSSPSQRMASAGMSTQYSQKPGP